MLTYFFLFKSKTFDPLDVRFNLYAGNEMNQKYVVPWKYSFITAAQENVVKTKQNNNKKNL